MATIVIGYRAVPFGHAHVALLDIRMLRPCPVAIDPLPVNEWIIVELFDPQREGTIDETK